MLRKPKQNTTRLAPLEPPYDDELQTTLARMMPPDVVPLRLFRTIAHNRVVLERFRQTGTTLLNFGSLEPRDRELVLHRTCARCDCDYEWGVHVELYGRPLGFTDEQLASLATGSPTDACWSAQDRLLIRLADELHDSATMGADLWSLLATHWSDEQLVELVAVSGFYHLVSYTANAFAVQPEEWAAPLPM